MNNILVLVDVFSGAERIAKLSLKVAQQLKANLLLCSVAELAMSKPLVPAGVHHNDQYEEQPYTSIEELADNLKTGYYHQYRNDEYHPQISCLPNSVFNTESIKQLVIDNQISMIITATDDLLVLKTSGLLNIINNSNAPVLVIPDHVKFNSFDSIAYLTDLRYCDVQVVEFLKQFNAKIFVTHVSTSGIPDMDDNYAQSLLTEAVANKVAYNKLFLRNIKGNNRKKDLEHITTTAAIQLFAIVNNKHYVLERFLSDVADTRRNYHNMPVLIMPYPNWYRG